MSIAVSVIIPIFNAEKFLPRTLKYLQAQTLQEIEFILVDDGSNDSSPAICDIVCEQDSRFRCIHKENGGVSAARNDGIEMARGEYLAFCDADDIPDPNWAKKLFEKAKEENADIALCGFTKQQDENFTDVLLPDLEIITEQEDIHKKIILPMCVWGYGHSFYGSVWRGVYKKQLIKNNGIRFSPKIRLGEDMIFNIHAFSSAKKIAFVNEALYTYIENTASATHTNLDILWKKYLSTWNAVKKAFSDLSFSETEQKWESFQLTRYAVSAIIEGICSAQCPKKEKKQKIKTILASSELCSALRDLPDSLSLKQKVLCYMLRPSLSGIVLAYYQNIYNKNYRR